MHKVAVIATSLNPESRSQSLARRFAGLLEARGTATELVDLRELQLPLAGPPAAWDHPDAKRLASVVAGASHLVFAVPIYHFDVNAAAKNVIELVGRPLAGKVVGFICTAGGRASYMAVMGLANHLMLDFRAVIVPRFVYVAPDDWDDDRQPKPDILKRLGQLCEDLEMIRIAGG
jgi:NAD(P)H-dependent FMN reductase